MSSIKIRSLKAVKRITVLPASDDQSTLVYRPKRRKKKGSRGLRVLEKLARRSAEASRTFSDSYMDRHSRSNRKKRDGWLRDLGYNIFKSDEKARKKLKLARLLRW